MIRQRLWKIFKPSWLTWCFLLVCIFIQCMLSTSTTTLTREGSQPTTHTIRYGFGPSIEMISDDTSQEVVYIHWIFLSLNLFLSYGVSALGASFILRITQLQRPFLVYGSLLAGIVCLAFLVALGVSQWYWGYMFDRPPVLKELHEVEQVSRIIPVKAEQRSQGTYDFVVNPEYVTLEDAMPYQRHDYYALDERMLFALHDRDLLPDKFTHHLAPYEHLYHDVEKTQLLAQAQSGYTSAGELRGIVIVATTTTGAEYIFLGANGRQVENDHYPYYEMVFEHSSDSETLTFLHGQRFFYDVAGLEGVEWFALWLVFSLGGIFLILPLFTGGVVVQKFVQYRKNRQREMRMEVNV